MSTTIEVPGIGPLSADTGFNMLDECSDGHFSVGRDGVTAVIATGDKKVEFIVFNNHTLAYVKSSMGYPAYYPVNRRPLKKPVKAVLMDLDGTSVHSEHFWIWIIEQATASLLGNPAFKLEENDTPFVSGHSVSEHLHYCVKKYCPHKTVEEARKYYFEHTHREMHEILEGRGKPGAFTPSPGLKEFLLELKKRNIKIGLVTSGLYEKAYPEIVSAFTALDMGDPKEFYDSIITAGFPLNKGCVGTMGELAPKPHPWLYAEVARVGLGLSADDMEHVVGIEDSGAGVCSILLAGFTVIGYGGGNIDESGTRGLCDYFCNNFDEVLKVIS
jgi:beta-phosphoglucomutase-like phosphatase (HAD superfamily)